MRSLKDIHAEAKAIDKIVGRNLRTFRLLRGFSQKRLGDDLALTFQQIQKYEKGANRLSAGKLCQIARILDVSLEKFFEGVTTINPNVMLSRQSLGLAHSIEQIPDPKVKFSLLKLLKTLNKEI